jgi:hypothetical protein
MYKVLLYSQLFGDPINGRGANGTRRTMQGTCPNVLIENQYCSSIDYAYHSLIATMKFYAFDQRVTHPRFGMQQLWQRALAMLYLYWANQILVWNSIILPKIPPKPGSRRHPYPY